MPKTHNRSKTFNKKQSVRFVLVPGPQREGKPTTTFRAVQSHNSKLSAGQRENIIKQLTGDQFDKIEINGREVDQTQIPAFILQQIRGRKDLIYNDKMQSNNGQACQDDLLDEGHMQLHQDQDQYYEPQGDSYYHQNQIPEDEGEWESDLDCEQEQVQTQHQNQTQQKPFNLQEEEFPIVGETTQIEFEGVKYVLTKKQHEILNSVIPDNYETLTIPGVQFKKFSEEGLDLKYKDKYEKFYADNNRAVTDSYDYVPTKPLHIVDNDLKKDELKGEMKDIEEALDWDGQQGAYEQLEDDFFAKLIGGQTEGISEEPSKQKKKSNKKKSTMKNLKQNNKVQGGLQYQGDGGKFQAKSKNKVFEEPEITDQMLEQALKQFENGAPIDSSRKNSEQQQFDVRYIQKMEQYLGKDGQLDWRILSRQEKKEYMRTKKIRQFYDEVRQRQLEQKMKGKKNINPNDLHLKQWIQKIDISQDYAMQATLAKDDEKGLSDSSSEDEDTTSEEDDITSYRMKTSVIASNLSIIEEPPKKKKQKKVLQGNEQDWQDDSALTLTQDKFKFVPKKRDRNQTQEQRKKRKQAVKQGKKTNKQSRREFSQQFAVQKRKFIKSGQGNTINQLHKVSCVKII